MADPLVIWRIVIAIAMIYLPISGTKINFLSKI